MDIIEKQKLEQIINWLKSELKPTKLYLYGSRATGTAKANSDYDFCALIPDFQGGRIDRQLDIMQTLKALFNVEVQIWIYNQEEFEFRKNDFSSIPETAINTGIEIKL